MLRKLCAFLLAVLCLGTLALPAGANESEIDQALEALVDMDPAIRAQGAGILAAYPVAAEEKALPRLLESLEADPDLKVKTAVVECLGEIAKVSEQPDRILKPLAGYLDSEELSLALTAALVLENFSKMDIAKATHAKRFALYRKGLASEETRLGAAECLANSTHPESLKVLAEALKVKDSRELALRALVVQDQEAALPLVVDFVNQALVSDQADLRTLGLMAATELSDLKPIESALVVASKSSGISGIRAAGLLYKITPGPDKLEPFRQGLKSDEQLVVESALVAVSNLEEADQKVMQPDIVKILDGTDDPDLIQTIFILSRAGASGNPNYLPAMVKKVGHESTEVRLSLAKAIPEYGARSIEGLDALEKLLQDEEVDIQVTALQSVHKLTGDFSKVSKTLEELAQDDKAFEVLISNLYLSNHSELAQAINKIVFEKSKAGKDVFFSHLARQSSELTTEELQLFLQNFDKLSETTRSLVISRLYLLHAARPGVMEFLEKALNEKGEAKWTAANIYLSFTGDSARIRPFIAPGLKSTDPQEVAQALSALMQQSETIGEYRDELSIVIHSDLEDYLRTTAFTVLAFDEKSAPFTAQQALKLLRGGEYKLAETSSEYVFAELGKILGEADKKWLVDRLATLHRDQTSLFESMSEVQSILKIAGENSGWPSSLITILKDIQKNSPDQTSRQLAGNAIKKMEGDS